jgi:hypothetical protein
MAAGSEIPQKGVLQASGYTPSEYHPIGIEIPTGAGALWAGVGQTALAGAQQFGNQLQNSRLNPAFAAQQDYQKAQFQQGQDQIAYMKSLGPMGHMFVQTTPQGASMTAPASISDPTMAARFMEAAGVGPKVGAGGGNGNGGPPTVNNPAAGNQSPYGGLEEKSTGAQQQQQPKGPPTAQEMGRGQASADTGDSRSASTDNDFLLQRMMQERQAVGLGGSDAAQQGTPASMTFTNPATGNVEPLQTPSVFASRGGAQAPAAPTGPPPQAQTPAAATQTDQAAMAKWQAQNAHPVMTSQEALGWMKNQTTLAQDATYLPMGGPNGSPAYAFHMKGGGMNIVPISQMIQKGAGPLVAAQNTSAVISQTDQAQGGAAPMPSGTGAGAPQGTPAPSMPPGPPPAPGLAGMPSGTGAGAPQPVSATPGPPPAPGPQAPITDVNGNPLGAYTNVASRGGLTPDQLTAQTAPGGQPAQPAPQPGQPLNPAPSNTTVAPAEQAAIQAQANHIPKPTGAYQGDPIVPGTTGPYTYYRDDKPNSTSWGRIYTTLPGGAGHYFDQQRWYLGTDKYEPYELPESAARQQMWDKWGSKGFLTRDQINGMGAKEMEPWLQRAWQNDAYQRSSPTEGLNSSLTTSEQYHNSIKRIGDIIQTLGANGYPNLSARDLLMAKAKNAAVSLGAGPTVPGMDEYAASAIRDLDEELGHAHDLLKAHPELGITPGKTEGTNLPAIKPAWGVEIPEPNIPGSDALYDAAYSGRPMNLRLKTLNGLQTQGDARYKDLVNQAQTQWMRIDPRHDANVLKISQGQDIEGNDYQGHTYPSEFPTVKPEDYGAWAKAHPGGTFMTPGPNPKKLTAPK